MVMSLIQGLVCHQGTIVAYVAAGVYLFVIVCISIGFFIFSKRRAGERRGEERRGGRAGESTNYNIAKAIVISFMRSNNKARYAMTLPVKVCRLLPLTSHLHSSFLFLLPHNLIFLISPFLITLLSCLKAVKHFPSFLHFLSPHLLPSHTPVFFFFFFSFSICFTSFYLLSLQVTAFSLSYIIVQYIVIFLAFARPLGEILSILVATILGPFMFFVMFFMLFFPSKFLYSCLGLNRIVSLFLFIF